MYRRNGYTRDIQADDVYVPAFGTMIVAFIIAAILAFLGWAVFTDNQKSIGTYNDYAKAYNALSEHDREIVAPYLDYELPEGETTLPLKTADKVGYWIYVLDVAPYVLICLAIVLSVINFISYWYHKKQCYALADLPFRKFYGWVLFFSMIPGWPVLLISRIIMWIKAIPWHEREQAAVEDEAKRQLDAEAHPLTPALQGRRNEKAKSVYVSYVVRGRKAAHDDKLSDLRSRRDRIESDIKSYANSVRRLQREKSEVLAELKLVEVVEPEEATRERAAQEWTQIREMRGVVGASVHKGRGKRAGTLCIDVAVRVPYKGEIYDFGDYRIAINGTSYRCERTRSGVRIDATSHSPDYNESSGFCFGSRRGTISDYVNHGRYLEAITLMIDSLHSVNDPGAEEMIPRCFRKVETIERTKKRLATQSA